MDASLRQPVFSELRGWVPALEGHWIRGSQCSAYLIPGPCHDHEEDPADGNGVNGDQEGDDDFSRNIECLAHPQNGNTATCRKAEQENQNRPPSIGFPKKVGGCPVRGWFFRWWFRGNIVHEKLDSTDCDFDDP